MNQFNETFLAEFCKSGGITPSSGTTGQKFLRFVPGALRTICVHVVPPDVPEYLGNVLRCVLDVDRHWLVVPRVSQPLFGQDRIRTDTAGLAFDETQLEVLVAGLIGHLDGMWSVNGDLWLVGKSAKVILSWDHHMLQEGLNVYVKDLATSNQLLVSLNNLGTELDLYQ